jgi:hypothetical protein
MMGFLDIDDVIGFLEQLCSVLKHSVLTWLTSQTPKKFDYQQVA